MTLRFTARQNIRKSFARQEDRLKIPFLLSVQTTSYANFLQLDTPPEKRKDIGLEKTLRAAFPIVNQSGTVELSYAGYSFDEPRYHTFKCKERGYTYEASLKCRLGLSIFKRRGAASPIEYKEQEVFLCNIPLMTSRGTFIINGIEKTIVSQLHRSPGVYFEHNKGSAHSHGKLLYSARIIPSRGSWLDFEFDHKDCLYVRIDRKRKLLASILLRAWGLEDIDILRTFFENEHIELTKKQIRIKLVSAHLKGRTVPFDIKWKDPETKKEEVLIPAGQRIVSDVLEKLKKLESTWVISHQNYLLGKLVAKDIVSLETGEVITPLNTEISEEMIEKWKKLGVKKFEILHLNEVDRGPYMAKTLAADKTNRSVVDAQFEIYQVIRPGDRFAPEVARKFLESIFFSIEKYSLSAVGRFKINSRLGKKGNSGSDLLSIDDVIDILKLLIGIRDGRESVDDIDSLANRRVRCAGEIVENVIRLGLLRLQKLIKERLTIPDGHNIAPKDLFNSKPLAGLLREFFFTSQLVQFTEQNNPLSEVTHTRRISALGPGGLTRERAGFDVRDVHPTHYGRLCPIATPEGPNTGLISSAALFSRVNDHGFLETPYARVVNSRQTGEICWMTAFEEKDHVIAQANSTLDDNMIITDDLVFARKQGEFVHISPSVVNYMDISPKQIVSTAAALIPFLEHDDGNRALMGSNMQRQAVPVVHAEAPLIGTGVEEIVARDSGAVILAKRGGTVYSSDSRRIMIHADATDAKDNSPRIDIYRLTKFRRSNQNTCINHNTLVNTGDKVQAGDVLADNSATSKGELAIGQNVLIAFMPWNGYNFEDSLLVSERLVRKGYFTSIRIEEFTLVARTTKAGDEEITSDIPNISEYQLGRLSDAGIIYIGAHVKSDDILVGKITPKGDVQQTSEEKLLHAIFGEKAYDVRDTSLRVPIGIEGTVVDIRIFTRDGIEKDEDAIQIEEREIDQLRKDYEDESTVLEEDLFQRVKKLIIRRTILGGAKDLGKGKKITEVYLNSIDKKSWFDIRLQKESLSRQLEELHKEWKEQNEYLERQYQQKCERVRSPGKLPPDVLKTVKIHIAVKSRIQPGDKLAGRHGNKGVISMIVPEEDMPFTKEGKTVDIVLNPLGVPSRLNVGQVFEAHLGWAAKGLGEQIDRLLKTQAPISVIRKKIHSIYNFGGKKILDQKNVSDEELMILAQNVRNGVPMACPVFDGASEEDIKSLLEMAGLPRSGQTYLYDGRTGERFDRKVTIGCMYILKLNHLVEDKMHARSTGHYSIITQQPLGGKSMLGGQRFGEMEVWALEAYGASHILREMLTVKSDDIHGRNKTYSNIVKNLNVIDTGMPESFSVLMKEIRSLALNIEFVNQDPIRTNISESNFFPPKRKTDKFSSLDRIKGLSISLASPEVIRSWSFGEVKKAETINYRTLKPERNGLFCAKIFGPVRDFECLCGKYKRLKHRGIICEKCGVEVTRSSTRRERMGHIELACPVAHIWFLKSFPSRISIILGKTLREVERVLYCENYMVTDSYVDDVKDGEVLNAERHLEIQKKYSKEDVEMKIGAEAILDMLKKINLVELKDKLSKELAETTLDTKRKSITKQLHLVRQMLASKNLPEHMILTVLPILPPELRPLVALSDGRFASSDLNDLYRRVINRNTRLKRLMELGAPDIMLRNEKRMLQEAVDSLLDNGRHERAVAGSNKRPLKSLSDNLKGKQGRFRQNLLGKRVDYSGRSVIVVGPTLRLHQCGLPKLMALELFRPFLIGYLNRKGQVTSHDKSAKKMLDVQSPEVWDALNEVVKEYPILLNRAPTLHRLGIQAFEPVLIEGKAIQLHPLVCAAFNADFDGDQMAVHVPISVEAKLEARCLMLSTNNVLSPSNGSTNIIPSQDIVLGLYYMTRDSADSFGNGMLFADIDEVQRAYLTGGVSLHAKITVRINPKDLTSKEGMEHIETTVGRALLARILPKGLDFSTVNRVLNKRAVLDIIEKSYHKTCLKDTVVFADHLMYMGFQYSTKSGVSFGVDDMVVPKEKSIILQETSKKVEKTRENHAKGLLSSQEKYSIIVDMWSHANENIAKSMMNALSTEKIVDESGKEVVQPSFNSIFVMADSGARGSLAQIRQLAGMRGLMAKPDGSIIENPITANFKEGLSVLQYFISSHGARKGLVDTALKTANSGYLTRRLVDVAQEIVISEQDCGTKNGIFIRAVIEGGKIVENIKEKTLGRFLAEDVIHPKTRETLIPAGTMLGEEHEEIFDKYGLVSVRSRSPLTCEAGRGICSKCYGVDLARGYLVNIGEAVGVIAAQSIGEPGTQLTMRTFHVGGTASRGVMINNVMCKSAGTVKWIKVRSVQNTADEILVVSRSSELHLISENGNVKERHKVPYSAKLLVSDGEKIKENSEIAVWDPHANPIIAETKGVVRLVNFIVGLTVKEQMDALTGLEFYAVLEGAKQRIPTIDLYYQSKRENSDEPKEDSVIHHPLPPGTTLNIRDGDEVEIGQVLAKIPPKSTLSVDITGGLPRVVELFEAREPSEPAILAEVSGVLSFGKKTRDKQRLSLTPHNPEEKVVQFTVPKDNRIEYLDGESVEKGDILVHGEISSKDILRLRGIDEFVEYLVREVQDVYRSQGVSINDKHIEIILRQMTKIVEITDPGDSTYLLSENIPSRDVLEENIKLEREGKRQIKFNRSVFGITKASLKTNSFISAASFQETTRVLTEAAIKGSFDPLRGLKENVIIGRLIPAGTGFRNIDEAGNGESTFSSEDNTTLSRDLDSLLREVCNTPDESQDQTKVACESETQPRLL